MRLIFLFASITLAVVIGFVSLQFLPGEATQERQVVVEKPVEIVKPEPTRQILVATRYIAPGTTIDQTMVDRQDWPQRLLVDQFVIADAGSAGMLGKGGEATNIIGMVARAPFQPREPFMLSKLAKDGDPSFIASTLPNGQRIVTIATDGINGVAGFVYPGDRVDVLLTHNVDLPPDPDLPPNAPVKQEQLTEPLLINVPVIAVDQRSSSQASEKPTLPTSVSLQVAPEDAQKLRLAEKRGSLSLALRSLKDKDETMASPTTRLNITHFFAEPTGEAADGTANAQKPMLPKKEEKDKVTVVRGVAAEEVQFDQPESDANNVAEENK